MDHAPFSLSPTRSQDRLPSPYRDEHAVLADLIARLPPSLSHRIPSPSPPGHRARHDDTAACRFSSWNATPLAERAAVLRRAGDALERRLPEFCGLLVCEAHDAIARHGRRLENEARLIGRAKAPAGRFIAPVAFEVAKVADVQTEIFGPVLHVVRWSGEPDAVIAEINALGYGLTLGLQTRIDSRGLRLASLARIGNVYVNRNMIGAVVGVQPFGGEGLSGTGPKAGGPHYLTCRASAPSRR